MPASAARARKPRARAARSSMPARLPALGVFGFDRLEPVILAALVTEDPLLLIGRSGTGKTYLLNTLSEALELEHRHYNASLIAFDDLVGFPYPEQESGTVRFLETPATVWQAESVLIDEISRCKPEHQNRLFALVHERRVQGIALPRLRYRWAAMNPCSADQDGEETYTGSEALDPALADRFALFVRALDWEGLSAEERRRVADPGGEGRIAEDGGALRRQIAAWRERFLEQLETCPPLIVDYATAVVGALNDAGVRVSPRRARLLARSLLAATVVTEQVVEPLFRLVLEASLPHATWGVSVSAEVVAAAHRLAWDTASQAPGRWIHAFLGEPKLAGKLALLLDECRDPDAGSQAVSQLLAAEPKERMAAFAFAVYPAAAVGRLPIGADGVNDLARVATPMLAVDGEIAWQERLNQQNTRHPEFERFARAGNGLKGARGQRARQFFSWCLVEKVRPSDPGALESELHACVQLLKRRSLA
jgi:MoxR-like ATPase